MSLISRITTWTVGQLLKSADLNGEFNNIVNTLNNLDGAATRWTNVDATTFKRSGNTLVTLMQAPVISTSTTSFATGNGSFQSTNLNASITPTNSSSKILVFATGTLASNATSNGAISAATIFGTANGNLGASAGMARTDVSLAAGSFVGIVPCTLMVLDSPATTATQTYAVKIAAVTGANTAQWGTGGTTQTMMLFELL